MRQRLTFTLLLLALLPCVARAQWTFDIVSVEAYIGSVLGSGLPLAAAAA